MAFRGFRFHRLRKRKSPGLSSRGRYWRLANRDWRINLGLALTLCWIVGGLAYLGASVGFVRFAGISVADMGSFLEGAFAPLAFLWLVLGLFMQQKEISLNTEQLRRSLEQSRKQTEVIAAQELNARQQAFFKIAQNAQRQQGGVLGMLLISVQGVAGDGSLPDKRSTELWQLFGGGDDQVFARYILSNPRRDEDWEDFYFGTEIRRRHTSNFIAVHEKLLKLAEELDIDGIIVGSLTDSSYGLVYRRMLATEGFRRLRKQGKSAA